MCRESFDALQAFVTVTAEHVAMYRLSTTTSRSRGLGFAERVMPMRPAWTNPNWTTHGETIEIALRAMRRVPMTASFHSVSSLRRAAFPAMLCAAAAAALAGCAQAPRTRSSEYFPESMYGKASPKLVADGEAVPRGGGQYLVGRPYTVAGRTYYPREIDGRFTQVGMASWYGDAFHGRRTANGEIYDKMAISAAHPTMPLPSYARVTNMRNGRSIIVRVNDRGPYHAGRVMDVSSRVAEALDFRRFGTAQVKVEYVGRASLAGSDDAKLMASLRTDGSPASLDGFGGRGTMLADSRDPTPGPMPVRSVGNEQAPFRTAEADTTSPLVALQSAPMPAHAPMPPSRPFDLGPGSMPDAFATGRRRTALFYAAEPADRAGPFGAAGLRDGRGLRQE